MTKIFIRFLIITIVLSISTVVIKSGIANHYADEHNRKSSIDELLLSISWNPKQPYALGEIAKHHLSNKNYKETQDFAFKALASNPTYGLATALIIESSNKQKNNSLPLEAIDLTKKLWPAHTKARNHIAKYWTEKNQILNVIPEWDIILSQDPQFSSTLFPILFQITQSPSALPAFSPYAKKPSVWWSRFFNYLTRQKGNLDSLKWLYQARLASDSPLLNTERRNYIERLLKEKQWVAAYFGWLSGLEKKHEQYLSAKLYDGGFEGELYNTGFDWHYTSNKIIKIRPDITRGMHGKASMHIAFKKKKHINFQHISQRLRLNSGSYLIKMRSRVDRLKTNKGLKWRVRCLGDKTIVLGEGRSLLGSSAWKNETFRFTIPDNENCQAQLLRLEASSSYPHNQVFLGDIWFDDIIIRTVEEEPKRKKENTTLKNNNSPTETRKSAKKENTNEK